MSQRCGRREDDETCSYPAAHEIVASTDGSAPVGTRVCVPCGANLARRGLAELADVLTVDNEGDGSDGR